MKRIKTVNGVISIEELGSQYILERTREIITDHRATLIRRLLTGLEDYIFYKFQQKPTPHQLGEIRDRMLYLKSVNISLDDHKQIASDVLEKELTVVTNAFFYTEIDEGIKWYLK